ncbi:unnamed protein product [Cochlearia groenlandica]
MHKTQMKADYTKKKKKRGFYTEDLVNGLLMGFSIDPKRRSDPSALFNFHSFLTVVLLVICTCTYLKMQFPAILEQKTGFRGFFWKAARIGERLSPWVSVGCLMMGVSIIFF